MEGSVCIGKKSTIADFEEALEICSWYPWFLLGNAFFGRDNSLLLCIFNSGSEIFTDKKRFLKLWLILLIIQPSFLPTEISSGWCLLHFVTLFMCIYRFTVSRVLVLRWQHPCR